MRGSIPPVSHMSLSCSVSLSRGRTYV